MSAADSKIIFIGTLFFIYSYSTKRQGNFTNLYQLEYSGSLFHTFRTILFPNLERGHNLHQVRNRHQVGGQHICPSLQHRISGLEQLSEWVLAKAWGR